MATKSQIINYFTNPENSKQKQYEALRAFFAEELSAQETAEKFGYGLHRFYSITKAFRKEFEAKSKVDPFFISSKKGRKHKDIEGELKALIIDCRKQYLSIPDIKAMLDAKGHSLSLRYIHLVLKKEGFSRLPRRSQYSREDVKKEVVKKIEAPKSIPLSFELESFSTQNTIGILCLIPLIERYGIREAIENAGYPGTSVINTLSSILCFLALKLSNIRRYSADDLWCMDRATGLLAGLNVLPKTGWYTSYSHRVTREMNLKLLKKLQQIWLDNNFVSDTSNLDFTVIPYWGDDSHLENNWSGKRHKALTSMLAVLAQDPDSGIITYGDTTVRHENESKVVLEFLDFYRQNKIESPKYLVFDSKFTTYENLSRLDEKGIKFITIRRRGENIVEQLESKPSSDWKKIRVMKADGKGRILKVVDEILDKLKDYNKQIRQVAITGHGKIKPCLIITNDFQIKLEDLIRKYSRRWIVEKEISEQIDFFHLNQVSSSIVIKVDFDLTMSILAHNLYRVFASQFSEFSHFTDQNIFEKFFSNSGIVQIAEDSIIISLKKKRHLPYILTVMKKFVNLPIPWLENKKIIFRGATTT